MVQPDGVINAAHRPRKEWRRRLALLGLAIAVHGIGGLWLAQNSPTSDRMPQPPILDVALFRPPPPVPPVQPDAAPTEGGGAAAAPSVVRPAPAPPSTPVEITAPPEPAPEPDPIIVGPSPVAGPAPGQGQGGEGTGSGGGSGSGSGPGSGGRFQLLRGPSVEERRRAHPPAALRAGRSGSAAMSCVIGLDGRLSDCEVVNESPAGQGFGQAALTLAYAFQARPPVVNGQPQAGVRGIFGVEFGRSRP